MRATIILLATLLVLCSGVASAQTPNDPSPAPETGCDLFSWAVYGLGDAQWTGMVLVVPPEDVQATPAELPAPTEQSCTCTTNNCGGCNPGWECLRCCQWGFPCGTG
jgi:hypothetical protein